jgi:hypothetical protein
MRIFRNKRTKENIILIVSIIGAILFLLLFLYVSTLTLIDIDNRHGR